MSDLYINALIKSLKDLFSGKILKTVLGAALLSFVLLLTLVILVFKFFPIIINGLPFINQGSILVIIAGWGSFVIALFTFPATLLAVSCLYVDSIAEFIEDKHYKGQLQTKSQPLSLNIALAVKFFFIIIGINILALPLYLIPIVNTFLFFIINGFLIGYEYFELIAMRYYKYEEYKGLRKKFALHIFIAGFLLSFMLPIPIINLILPIFATIYMVHFFHAVIQRNLPLLEN